MHTRGAHWWYDPKLAPKHRSTTKFLVICRLFWTIWPMNEYVTTIDDEIVSTLGLFSLSSHLKSQHLLFVDYLSLSLLFFTISFRHTKHIFALN